MALLNVALVYLRESYETTMGCMFVIFFAVALRHVRACGVPDNDFQGDQGGFRIFHLVK